MSTNTGTKKKLNVHFRILTTPLNNDWDMLNAAKNLFSQYNIEINLKSRFPLENECPPQYKEREIRYKCIINDPLYPLTNQEKELYAYARDYDNIRVKDLEFVCYFITSCYFKQNSTKIRRLGCTYYDARGSIIISQDAPLWTFAHECGHCLDLTYHNEQDKNHLMNPDTHFTGKPYLTKDEIKVIQNAQFLTT